MATRNTALPLALLGAVVTFVAFETGRIQAKHRRSARTVARQAVAPQGVPMDSTPAVSTLPDTALSQSTSADVSVRATREPPPPFDTAYVTELLREGSPGTYLGELLGQQENLLMRWPERRGAMRVWIEREPRIAGWDPQYPLLAERAFAEWQEAGFPLHFDLIRDPIDVDIGIKWIEKFPTSEGRKLGVARKVRDQYGRLVSAEIDIAIQDPAGQPLPASLVAGTARHEIGHALGLGHSSNTTDVMFPESHTPAISAADRKTLHLLYMLPPGRMP